MGEHEKLGEVVFVHDYAFIHGAEGQVYSDRGDWTWHRYLHFAKHVTVASRGRGLDPDDRVEDLTLVSGPGISYQRLPTLSGALARYANRREAARGLESAIGGADALVARLPSELGSLAIRVAERLGKPWAVEVVTCTWDALWNHGTWQGKVYAPIAWWTTRRLVGRSERAVYETQTFLQGRYPSPGKTAGIPIVELPAVDDAVLERRLERIAAWVSPLRIGLIGALSVGFKGIDTAIEALRLRRGELPEFELRILGSGDPSRWRRLSEEAGLANHIVFDAVLPSGEPVHHWLDGIDLYIQPSFQEGLPRGTLEAMSRGAPVLASTAGGLPELLDAECLHRPGDAARLGQLLVHAAGDPEWQTEQARRNFAVARRYSKPVLDEARNAFWSDFVASIRDRA